MTGPQTSTPNWRVHDSIAGVLSGGGLGAIAGLVLAVRVFSFDAGWAMLAGAVIGSLVGILMLVRSHADSGKFVTPTVIVMWIVALASGTFLWLLYDAIRNFE